MSLIEDLLTTLPEGEVLDLRVGPFWTTVVVEVAGRQRCGLASSLRNDDHHHTGKPAVLDAGRLLERSARQLAELSRSDSLLEAAIGMAATNALLPRLEQEWVTLNAEEVIVQHGRGKQVALIGHFPFIPRLQEQVGKLWVLEQRPRNQDLPAEAASDILPQAEVVALTGTTLLNHTFENLINLCQPDALVLVLGPSTPLSPMMFDYGADILSGSVVEDIDRVVQAASQGANFQQLHRQGVQLVTMKGKK